MSPGNIALVSPSRFTERTKALEPQEEWIYMNDMLKD
jgi:hypothetical protein